MLRSTGLATIEKGRALISLHFESVGGQGLLDEGIEQMRQGLSAWRATGGKVGLTLYIMRLAESYWKANQVNRALCVLDEAMDEVRKTGALFEELS